MFHFMMLICFPRFIRFRFMRNTRCMIGLYRPRLHVAYGRCCRLENRRILSLWGDVVNNNTRCKMELSLASVNDLHSSSTKKLKDSRTANGTTVLLIDGFVFGGHPGARSSVLGGGDRLRCPGSSRGAGTSPSILPWSCNTLILVKQNDLTEVQAVYRRIYSPILWTPLYTVYTIQHPGN